jgi:hypothetical protein
MFNPDLSRGCPQNRADKGLQTLTPDTARPKPSAPVYAQAFDDPTPPPAHPFLYPTMSISEPGEAPTEGGRRAGRRAYRPIAQQRQRPFQAGFSPPAASLEEPGRTVKIVPPDCPVQGTMNKN